MRFGSAKTPYAAEGMLGVSEPRTTLDGEGRQGGGTVVQQLHREMAATIRQVVIDPEVSDRSRELAAAFSRQAADHLKADCPAFSYDWFFGACGLDNWGELLTDQTTSR